MAECELTIRDPAGQFPPVVMDRIASDGQYEAIPLTKKRADGFTSLGAARRIGPLYGQRFIFNLAPDLLLEQQQLLMELIDAQDERDFLYLDNEIELFPQRWWGNRDVIAGSTVNFSNGTVSAFLTFKVLLDIGQSSSPTSFLGQWNDNSGEARAFEFQALEVPLAVV